MDHGEAALLRQLEPVRASSNVSPSRTTVAPKRRVFSTFTAGAKRGITMVAGMPRRCAW